VRDHNAGEVLIAHPSGDGVSASARSDRARPEGHGVFGPDIPTGAQRLSAEEAQDDALLVPDDADLPLVTHPLGDGRDEFVGQARRSARTGDAADAGAAVGFPFERKSERAPVGLAGGVVVDACEAEAFEPRRGS
jgi:hypothetical protein